MCNWFHYELKENFEKAHFEKNELRLFLSLELVIPSTASVAFFFAPLVAPLAKKLSWVKQEVCDPTKNIKSPKTIILFVIL